MINFKRIIYDIVVTLVTLAVITLGAPTNEETRPCRTGESNHYDQRQNGTENYRLNIDGVLIAVAPPESLLAAASAIDLEELLADYADFESQQKPEEKPPQVTSVTDEKPLENSKPDEKPISSNEVSKPQEDKPTKKKYVGLKSRLANILLPLLRKTRHP